MKILLINDYAFKIGGAEEMLFKTKELLQKKNHEVKILGAEKKGRITPLLKGWFSYQYFVKTQRLIKEFKPDIIHVHGCLREISPAPLVAAKQNHIPIVMTVHDFDIFGPDVSLITKNLKPIRKMKLDFQKYIIKKTIDYYVGPSMILCEFLSKEFTSEKVAYIPNFVDTSQKYSPDLSKIDPHLFILVGRLSREKGIDIAIRAIYIFINTYSLKNIKLNIIGDGPKKNDLSNLVKRLNIQNNITFTGSIPNKDLKKYYEKCLAVIVPSTYMENSPLVVYEAMTMCKPVIGTNIGGIPDLVVHNKTGYLFDMGNTKSLAGYMKKMYNNKTESIKKGLEGLKKVKEVFKAEEYYKNLLEIYNKLLES